MTRPGWAVQQGTGTEMSPCQYPRPCASGWRTQGCPAQCHCCLKGTRKAPALHHRAQGQGEGGSGPSPEEKPGAAAAALAELCPPEVPRLQPGHRLSRALCPVGTVASTPRGHTNPSFLLMARKLLFLANELKASVIFPRKHDKQKHLKRLCLCPSPRLAELLGLCALENVWWCQPWCPPAEPTALPAAAWCLQPTHLPCACRHICGSSCPSRLPGPWGWLTCSTVCHQLADFALHGRQGLPS